MSRFKPLGNFIYENGDRIGCTVEEANVEIAQKLNAYQMRIERLKAEAERLRASSFVTAVPSEEYEKLKAEVEQLDDLCKKLMNQHSNISCENIRLRKAGDAMVKVFKDEGYNTDNNEYCMEEIRAWNAAKDGRPSV